MFSSVVTVASEVTETDRQTGDTLQVTHCLHNFMHKTQNMKHHTKKHTYDETYDVG
jgi:hypothetical protein